MVLKIKRMMRGFLSRVFLLIAVVTALDDHSMAAATEDYYSWEGNAQSESQMNISTYGYCVGLHCAVADSVEANLFTDQHQFHRMLENTMKLMITPPTSNPNSQAACPGQKDVRYSSCLREGGPNECKISPYKKDQRCN